MINGEPPRQVKIPLVMLDWASHRKCDIHIDYQSVDCLNGYGQRWRICVQMLMLEEVCNVCGYSSLFSKWSDTVRTGHARHTYDRRYTPVFSWTQNNHISLEKAFTEWLIIQPDDGTMTFRGYGA